MTTAISLKQLSNFAALARSLHFRRAAEAEGVTQPSLSAQIAALEAALGLRLVERGRGPVTLTAPGREIAARARAVLDEVQGLQDHAAGLRTGSGGVLWLGTSATIGPYLLPQVVRDLHRSHPLMGLYIREGAPRLLEDQLVQGGHDAIITQLPLRGADLVARPLYRERLAVVLPEAHPLAARATIGNADLEELAVLSLGPAFALHETVAALCHETGARLVDSYQGTSLDGLRQMVGMGMGAAFLPALYIRSEIEGREAGLAVRPFRDGRLTRTVGLAWRRATGHLGAIARLEAQIRQTVARDFAADLVAVGP
jgi:LysR family hydrogen peroxide-inducible transcriptional activator